LAYLDNLLVAGTLVLYGAEIAYYGVGVYDRTLMARNIAIAHYNMLYSIYYAKKIGLLEFDLGSLGNSENEKEINIFKFKSGFSNLMGSRQKFIASFFEN
jgi:lipid II:glycine glycyltransferase (peptidoglycan interpeptide bridge formation enzyme)